MAMLTKFDPFKLDPFKPITRMTPWNEFDDMFRGFGLRAMPREFENLPEIRFDVHEDDKFYKVVAEIPGVKKDDIEISIEGDQVTISAEVKREIEKKETWKTIYSERYYGKAYRTFTLPFAVENGKAEAKFENGILTLMLPKKGNGHVRKVLVS
jgi:HSP20 family protein